MGILFTVYQGLLLVSLFTSVAVAFYAWKHREWVVARPIIVLFVGSTIWAFCAFMAVQYRGEPMAILWAKLWFIGVVATIGGFFLMALEYTGYEEYVNRRTVALLSIEPILFNLLIWVDEFWLETSLLWKVGAVGGGTVQGYEIHHGLAFNLHAVYSYLLMAGGLFLIAKFAIGSKSLYQRQSTAIFVAALAPWAGNVLYLSDTIPLDLTPVGYTIVGLAVGWAVWSADFLEIMPVARDVVVETLQDGMYVIDRQGRIVDLNDAGRAMLAVDDETNVVGEPIQQFLPDAVPFERFQELQTQREEQTVELSIGDRYFTVQTSPLFDAREQFIGTLFLVHDITEQKRRQNELEAKNERLDQFASVVSHDLRNPLNIASGYADLARESGDAEHFDRVDEAHERMETLIDELLALARQGKEISERETVSLSALVRNAWGTVETGNATLDVRTDATVRADADRLRQLFENLLRNSIEHGGSDVTVTVGILEGSEPGFYVEDDGPGIEPAIRDRLFEPGVTTNEDGTGFGLAVVRTVANAHGWDVAATDSAAGGARFAFVNVDSLRET